MAIGECGLDLYVEGLDAQEQALYFDGQLQLARQTGLPLIVHARRAVDAVIAAIRHLGITLVHVYGLTETYGPYSVCEPDPSWSGLSEADISVRMARQGVGELTAERMRVVGPGLDEQGRLRVAAATTVGAPCAGKRG